MGEEMTALGFDSFKIPVSHWIFSKNKARPIKFPGAQIRLTLFLRKAEKNKKTAQNAVQS